MQNDFNRIAPKLYMGCAPPPGNWWQGKFGVIVFCAKEYQPSDEGFPRVIRCPIDDANINGRDAMKAVQAAREVCKALHAGQRVLVTCMQGRNRSGLVTALALIMNGVSAQSAIQMIQSARPNALTNPSFVWWLNRLKYAPGFQVRQIILPISESP
jgi:Dual specificity phosphatase, catalytic domain